jgi:hypothetical protein
VSWNREQVRELLFRGIVLRPVTIDGVPRIVCRTTTGELLHLAPPSRDAQRPGGGGRGGSRPSQRSGRGRKGRSGAGEAG